MDNKKIGKLIKISREQIGFTQKQLAKMLSVTDKAVSKWERGISIPDQIILPKLSMILDIDIDHLIPNTIYSKTDDWQGVLFLENKKIDESTRICNKPIIEFLLSYFMLVGITDITILGCNKKYVKSLHLEKYGLTINFSKDYIKSKNKMIIYDSVFVFGPNLTRVFKSYMDSYDNIRVETEKRDVPILFTNENSIDINYLKEISSPKKLNRGMIVIPLSSIKKVKEAAKIVSIYENNSAYHIADLKEISMSRRLVK